MGMVRRYSDLKRLTTFDDRFDYLDLKGTVGEKTFGFDRWMNQRFYTSRLWAQIRDEVIVRDYGCDLGILGHDIHVGLLVHHMNPLTRLQIEDGDASILDPEYLITCSHRTHNAIHYGNRNLLPRVVVARRPDDTKLW